MIRPVRADAVRPLRHRVLRPGQPLEETVYPGDDSPQTLHLAAFDGDSLVGIASLYHEPRAGVADGWRLRGMATAPEGRGRGFGAALIAACVDHVAASGGGELWCNARGAAIGFYRRAGFEVVSEKFHLPGIGTHVVMRRAVPGENEPGSMPGTVPPAGTLSAMDGGTDGRR